MKLGPHNFPRTSSPHNHQTAFSQPFTMGLEEFERELAEEKRRDSKRTTDRSRDENAEHKHRHRHHHGSHRHGDRSRDGEERRHRHKRHRDREDGDEERRYRKRRRSSPHQPSHPPKEVAEEEIKVFDSSPEPDSNDEEDEWVEKEANVPPPEEDIFDQRDQNLREEKVQRDAWMQEPSGMDIEIVQSKKPKPPPSQFVGARDDHGFHMHESHLKDLERDLDSDADDDEAAQNVVKDEPAQHEVNYTFGDAGSAWRMTKLKAVYRQADESGRSVDDVALERYGDLRDFDDAREEEREVERRKMYGDEYVGLEKPSGELFQERKMGAGIRRESGGKPERPPPVPLTQGEAMRSQDSTQAPAKTAPLDPTALNKLKAQLMKAQLRNAPNTAELEAEYNAALAQASASTTAEPDVIVLNNMENRQLASGRSGEVSAVSGKRGRERGLVVENEEMSVADMVRQEKRTRGGGEGKAFAERIAKDGKFVDDLEYMDDNAEKLSKKVVKSDANLKSAAIGDYQRLQRILASCPLCYHEENTADPTPTAPVVSLATRTYLTLPTLPEISAKGASGAVIVPIQHRNNLLECDDDEWEEIRNFMKSLTRYYDALGFGVVFYENAAQFLSRRGHASLNAVPLPHHLAETAPAYFKEAILAEDERWSQHKPVIDTLALSQKPGYGKQAFRKAMVKELPYFHVFFTLDGGTGHVVEDERRWPKGDLFAREVLGGMLDRGAEVVKKQGRWEKGGERGRVEGFRRGWGKWDWTRALMEGE